MKKNAAHIPATLWEALWLIIPIVSELGRNEILRNFGIGGCIYPSSFSIAQAPATEGYNSSYAVKLEYPNGSRVNALIAEKKPPKNESFWRLLSLKFDWTHHPPKLSTVPPLPDVRVHFTLDAGQIRELWLTRKLIEMAAKTFCVGEDTSTLKAVEERHGTDDMVAEIVAHLRPAYEKEIESLRRHHNRKEAEKLLKAAVGGSAQSSSGGTKSKK